MAETSGGLVKASSQWTPEQYEWLQAESQRLGLASVAAAARYHVQRAMQDADQSCTHCPVHCEPAA